MKIVVLNGSPKGELSVTRQYVQYLEKKNPGHEWREFYIAQRIKKIESDPKAFDEIIAAVQESDVVIWSFPLYFLLVHSGYKRFIELLFEKKASGAFYGKTAAAISTSIHFYDHTAHNYIRGITEDLGMKYSGGFSADMADLLKKDMRKQLLSFGDFLFKSAADKAEALVSCQPVPRKRKNLKLGKPDSAIDAQGKTIRVITDAAGDDANIMEMTGYFAGQFKQKPEIINLRDIDIKGGCLGCIKCGFDNVCAYEGKDGFIDFFRDKVMTADILIFAGTIKDRYLSSVWKLFFDRTFFLTHQPKHFRKQVGFLISGPFGQLENLREILEGYLETNEANSIGYITDESESAQKIESQLAFFARQALFYSGHEYFQPNTFRGIGGKNIFRDDIYGRMRFIFGGDHRYYKKHGWYNFPQYDIKMRIINLLLAPLRFIPGFKKMFQSMIKQGMLTPYQKLLRKA